jgi:hypothetical protein
MCRSSRNNVSCCRRRVLRPQQCALALPFAGNACPRSENSMQINIRIGGSPWASPLSSVSLLPLAFCSPLPHTRCGRLDAKYPLGRLSFDGNMHQPLSKFATLGCPATAPGITHESWYILKRFEVLDRRAMQPIYPQYPQQSEASSTATMRCTPLSSHASGTNRQLNPGPFQLVLI